MLKAGSGDQGGNNSSLAQLVVELRRHRLINESAEGWTTVFTIIDRIMFVVSLLTAIVMLLCYVRV